MQNFKIEYTFMNVFQAQMQIKEKRLIMFHKMATAVNVSYGLYHYVPFLVDLQDYTYVQQTKVTFDCIYLEYCPGLIKKT